MKTPFSLLIALSATACATSQAPSPAAATSAEITTADLRHRLFLIADDSMMGRETGSLGDYKTAEYVAGEFRRLGYARYGIPAVAFSRGEHLDYHQITDEPQYIDYPDLARVTHMMYSAAMAIANMSHRPMLDAPKQTNPNAQCRQ